MKHPMDYYLGDGVYASYDGYTIWLDLRGQDDSTRIALEPPVVAALEQYIARVRGLLSAVPTGDAQ
jgi:hypothetical protein